MPANHQPIGADRRTFLLGSFSLAAAAVWSSRAVGAVKRNFQAGDHPFQLGVASGDPSSDGFVIWTRLAPDPLNGGGMPDSPVEVAWQVAEDEAMTKVVAKGTTVANPAWAHSVHVEVAGLAPDRWYFYQFKAGGDTSPVGRSRTLPAAGALPEKLRLAFASCQHWEAGLFTAYEHMAKEDLDLVLHLGDYIYEGPGKDGQVRKHIGPKLMTLADYRNRHAQYKTDPALQAAHAAFPWLVTWDDHELENNCAGNISERKDAVVEDFLKQRANAYQAYYEHMPLRRASLPKGPDMQLYRRVAYGRLAEFNVLDTRQYRTDQPCGDHNRAPCDEVYDEKATLMGDAQEKWLYAGLSNSQARWNVLAQQVMMARVDRTAGPQVEFSMDQWPGYEMNRRRILKHFHDHKVQGPIVLGGDIHSNWCNNLIADFDNLESRVVGTEFVATSISSGGDGSEIPRSSRNVLEENPFVNYYNAQRGYVRCAITKDRWQSDFQGVDYVTRPGAPLVTRVSYLVENEKPGAVKA